MFKDCCSCKAAVVTSRTSMRHKSIVMMFHYCKPLTICQRFIFSLLFAHPMPLQIPNKVIENDTSICPKHWRSQRGWQSEYRYTQTDVECVKPWYKDKAGNWFTVMLLK